MFDFLGFGVPDRAFHELRKCPRCKRVAARASKSHDVCARCASLGVTRSKRDKARRKKT